MLNRIFEWFARNTVAANLLMIGILLAGITGFSQLERETDPSIDFPGILIDVTWLGASPQDVEEQIVNRIEETLSDLDNVQFTRSVSTEGSGRVFMFIDFSADFTRILNEVKGRVDSISTFPRDIEPPRVQQLKQDDPYVRIALYGDVTERELKRLGESLRKEVVALPYISLVDVFGVRNEEVSIEVSEEALRRYGMTLNEVAAAIRVNSLNLSSGSVRTTAGEYALRARNIADSEADFANIIVRQTADGGTIRVGDVATVKDGFEENELLATFNGERAVLIDVLTTETMNIDAASAEVHKWVEKRSETLPAGVSMTIWQDDADDFTARLETISSSAILGLVLVFGVLMLSLRPKVAIWVTVGIGIAYAGAFVFMPAVDVSLNGISTFAFLLVLGIVVDDAIVVGEGIHAESQKNGGGITAAILGTQLVAKPVIFAVLTTIIAFLPWIFLDGVTSQFTRHITWVVILALSFSLVESLLILPAHLSDLKPREKLNKFGRFQKGIAQAISNFAERHYRRAGDWAVERRYMTTAIFIGIFIVGTGGIFSTLVDKAFQAEFESTRIIVNVNLPAGTPYERAEEVLRQMQDGQRQLIAENEGEGGAGNPIEHWYTRSRPTNVLALLKLVGPEERDKSPKELALRLRELIGDIPDAEEVTVDYTFNSPGPALEFSVNHPDFDLVNAAVADLQEQLGTYDVVYDIRNNFQGSTEEIRFAMKPGAEKLGLNLQEVTRQVRQAYFGEEVQRLPRDGEDVRVYVRLPRESRQSIESLNEFRIRTSDGREVPLRSVADLSYAPGINQILHWDGRRAVIVRADVKDDTASDIRQDLNDNFFPDWEKRYPGISREQIGQAAGEAAFLKQVAGLYGIAFFAMYALLAIAFKSYAQPILFLVAIPYAFVGAAIGHATLNIPMDILSYFGVAAAAGVVINDNLVLIDYCNRLRERGSHPLKAAVEAGVARFRPILLTTVTTIVGLIPMMASRAEDAASLKPITVSLAFGVGLAFFVSLFMVPALYSIGYDYTQLKARIKSRLFGGKPGTVPAQAE